MTKLFFLALGWYLIFNQKERPFQNLQVVLTLGEQDIGVRRFGLWRKEVSLGDQRHLNKVDR